MQSSVRMCRKEQTDDYDWDEDKDKLVTQQLQRYKQPVWKIENQFTTIKNQKSKIISTIQFWNILMEIRISWKKKNSDSMRWKFQIDRVWQLHKLVIKLKLIFDGGYAILNFKDENCSNHLKKEK